MKKFKFTLDTLLKYKDQVLDREKNELATLNARRIESIREIERLRAFMKEKQDEFNEKASRGVSALEMASFSAYHNTLRLEIENAEKALEDLEDSIEHQTFVVVEASKEVTSLEKLEEKQLEDYKFRAAKAEESFIEEYVNGAAVRNGLAQSSDAQ